MLIRNNSGVTRGRRGGRVAHPWKVWGKILEGREEEKGSAEGKRGGKGKERQGKIETGN